MHAPKASEQKAKPTTTASKGSEQKPKAATKPATPVVKGSAQKPKSAAKPVAPVAPASPEGNSTLWIV
jgi:hypothetical protein